MIPLPWWGAGRHKAMTVPRVQTVVAGRRRDRHGCADPIPVGCLNISLPRPKKILGRDLAAMTLNSRYL